MEIDAKKFSASVYIGFLPKSDKSVDSLKRFFTAVHSDRSLRKSMCQLSHPHCPSLQAAQCMVSSYECHVLRIIDDDISSGEVSLGFVL